MQLDVRVPLTEVRPLGRSFLDAVFAENAPAGLENRLDIGGGVSLGNGNEHDLCRVSTGIDGRALNARAHFVPASYRWAFRRCPLCLHDRFRASNHVHPSKLVDRAAGFMLTAGQFAQHACH